MMREILILILFPICCVACECKDTVIWLHANASYELWLHEQSLDWGHEQAYWMGQVDAYERVLRCIEAYNSSGSSVET